MHDDLAKKKVQRSILRGFVYVKWGPIQMATKVGVTKFKWKGFGGEMAM